MLGYLARTAVQGQWRSYQASRKAPGGKWTVTAVLFGMLPFTVLEMLAQAAQGSWQFWAWLPVNGLLVVLALASSGLFKRRNFERKVMTMYTSPEPDLLSPGAIRARIAELSKTKPNEIAPVQQRIDAAQAAFDDGTAALFSDGCPVCWAPAGTSCSMGAQGARGVIAGIPFVIVRDKPLAFCHFERMAGAVKAGTIRREDLLARFAGQLPGALLEMLERP